MGIRQGGFSAWRGPSFAGFCQPPPSAWNRLTTACKRANWACASVSWAWNSACWVMSTVIRSTVPSRNRVSAISNARRVLRHHLALQAFARGGLLHCDEGAFHVGKAVDDGLAVELQQLVLPAFLQVELSLQSRRRRAAAASGRRRD